MIQKNPKARMVTPRKHTKVSGQISTVEIAYQDRVGMKYVQLYQKMQKNDISYWENFAVAVNDI